MIFEFWKWRISVRTKRVDSEKKIAFLANALIKAMQDAGNQVALPDINNGYGSVDICLHRIGAPDAVGYVQTQYGKTQVKFVPDFNKWKVVKED